MIQLLYMSEQTTTLKAVQAAVRRLLDEYGLGEGEYNRLPQRVRLALHKQACKMVGVRPHGQSIEI